MVTIIIGFLFIVVGLYIIPLEESKYHPEDDDVPLWLKLFVWLCIVDVVFYIPMIVNIFITGLVKSGYIENGTLTRWFLYIVSVIFYVLIYKIYTTRLQNCRSRYFSD